MKFTLIAIVTVIALYAYGNNLRKKKKQLVNKSQLKKTYEVVETKLFTMEDLLKWYKAHPDVNDSDEYILSRVTPDTMKKGGIDIVKPDFDVERSLLMVITDPSHKVIKHSRIIVYSDIEKDILDLLGDKNLIVLE